MTNKGVVKKGVNHEILTKTSYDIKIEGDINEDFS